MLEHSMHKNLMQNQQFEHHVIEGESALVELIKTEEAYKIVGNRMVKHDKETLKADLATKKELFSKRVSVLTEQEEKFKSEANTIQKKLLDEMKE